MPFESRKLVEIYRPDDVDDRELSQIGVKHCETANLFSIHQQIDFEISFLLAVYAYEARPSWTTKLCPDRFDISGSRIARRFQIQNS